VRNGASAPMCIRTFCAWTSVGVLRRQQLASACKSACHLGNTGDAPRPARLALHARGTGLAGTGQVAQERMAARLTAAHARGRCRTGGQCLPQSRCSAAAPARPRATCCPEPGAAAGSASSARRKDLVCSICMVAYSITCVLTRVLMTMCQSRRVSMQAKVLSVPVIHLFTGFALCACIASGGICAACFTQVGDKPHRPLAVSCMFPPAGVLSRR